MNSIFTDYKEKFEEKSQEVMTLQEYLELCKEDPLSYASAAERMLKAIGTPTVKDTADDMRLARIFLNRKINIYPAFAEFYGMEKTVESIVGFFKHAAQGLEERKQILYLLGPVGGGKSSLAEKLKSLMEKIPFYTLAIGDDDNLELSPVFESPLGLFEPEEWADRLEDEYGIPHRYLTGLMSPWATKRLTKQLKGDISQFKVVRLTPSKLAQIAIAKTEPGDDNNQDISDLVGKVDIRKLNKFEQNDPDCYSFSGGLCRGNQGILEFVEMFKAPIKVLHPLLTATQEGNYKGTENIAAIPFHGIILAHCFSEDTELLTENGWKGIDEVQIGDSIATLNKSYGIIEYQPALHKYEENYVGDMHHMKSSCADHLVTPNHKMIYESYGNYKQLEARDFYIKGAKIPVSGITEKLDWDFYANDDEIRFHTQCITDGSIYYEQIKNNTYNYRFHLKKQRKIDRLINLLQKLDFDFKISDVDDKGAIHIYVKNIDKKFGKFLSVEHKQMSPRQFSVMLKEWSYTDGSYSSSRTEDHFQLSTNNKFHKDFIQEMSVLSKHKTTCAISIKEGYDPVYLLHIRMNVDKVRCDNINKDVIQYSGRVWCLETENHTLVARRNGKVMITGNSNESEWQQFRNNKTNEAFLDRISIVKVPYCTRVSDESNIYNKLIRESALGNAICSPKTMEMLSQFTVLTRIHPPENSNIFSKMRIYDGENLKDTDPKAKSLQEYKDEAGVDEGMTGVSTRLAFKVLSKVFNYDEEETAANPVHLLRVLEDTIEQEQFDEDITSKYMDFLRGTLRPKYIEFLEKEIKIAYLESYSDFGQNLFDRYIDYADHWIQDKDYRDPETGEMFDRGILNNELEKIEKPAEIVNPKEYRGEVVNFCLRYRAGNDGKNPKWTSYEKLRDVVEHKMFANTEDLLPVISFGKKSTQEDERKHGDFVSRMEESGYTARQVRLLVDWYLRARKSE